MMVFKFGVVWST